MREPGRGDIWQGEGASRPVCLRDGDNKNSWQKNNTENSYFFPSRQLLHFLLSVQQYHFCCCCCLVASVSICLLLSGESNTRPSPGRPECASCLKVSPVVILNKNVLFLVIWVQLVGAAWKLRHSHPRPLPLTGGHQGVPKPAGRY